MDFRRTIGHQKQKQLFRQILKNGKLGHAYAFAGPENIGKTTFALDLANLLEADPIFDVFLFDSESGLLIEEARALQNRLNLTPSRKHKVAIIAFAERMSLEAANSLLKTLEEPPEHSLLLLITSNFYALLPTITSRVQRVNFGLSSSSEVESGLQEFHLSEEKLSEITQFSQGRIGLARRLAGQPELLEFYELAEKYYQILLGGALAPRLQTSSLLAGLKPEQISDFLKFAMRRWVAEAKNLKIARNLQTAFRDLEFNLNTKLVLDNLFL